jgi:hypothetical protein
VSGPFPQQYQNPTDSLDTLLSKMFLAKVTHIALLAASVAAHFVVPNDDQNMSGVVVNGIPYSTRVKYMRLVCNSFLSGLLMLLPDHG